MAANLRVEASTEQDLPRLMEIVLPAFESIPFSQLVGDTSTPENKAASAQRHLRTWHEHAKNFKHPFGIKCIHTDLTSDDETIIASAEWAIYDRPRTESEYLRPVYLVSADWVADSAAQREAREFVKPFVEARVRWMGGRPHGLLLFMATDEKFRGQGAARKCIQWGLDRCTELDCPAILEASDMGKPIYEKMGFEVVERLMVGNLALPILIWWPPGWREEDKKEALPCYGK